MVEAAEEFHFSPRPNRASEINWRPWSQEAFEQARQTGRPILLSISAVWCHWCHVMDETTYSHAGVIDLINREYVPVRVDNDVRPDINQRYNMGGWPTTAFLTSSGDILTGGTYMPPDQMASALMKVADYYRSNQADIASRVLEARKRAASGVARSAGDLEEGLVDEILDAVRSAYDSEYGGFGNAPKFPQTDAILLLLEQSVLRSDAELRRRAQAKSSALRGPAHLYVVERCPGDRLPRRRQARARGEAPRLSFQPGLPPRRGNDARRRCGRPARRPGLVLVCSGARVSARPWRQVDRDCAR